MKKVLAFIMALVLIFGLCGCDFDIKITKSESKKSTTINTRKTKVLCEENIELLKNVEHDVEIVVCCKRKNYVEYMEYLAKEMYTGAEPTMTDVEYYELTLKILDGYDAVNEKINVSFIDPSSAEFTDIAADYVDEQLTYGDMIVTSAATEKYKILRFTDIYALSKAATYDYYPTYVISANSLESVLSSAVNYVTDTSVKNVGIIISRSKSDSYTYYKNALVSEGYDVELLKNNSFTGEYLKNACDVIAIVAPVIDFTDSEIETLSEFLDNNGNLGKGLVFFADATAPNLPNLYGFLDEWGIEVSEGKIYETDTNYMLTTTGPDVIALMPNVSEDSSDSEMITANNYAVTGCNVPMKARDTYNKKRTTKVFLQTSPSAVIAPKDAAANWSEYTPSDKKTFDCVIQSTESDFDKGNNEIQSYVMAFSSFEFIHSEWAEESFLYNKELVLKCTEHAAHVDDGSVSFAAKVIEEKK